MAAPYSPCLHDLGGTSVLTRDRDGALIALFRDRTTLGMEERLNPDLSLKTLIATTD
jgi:hypothetical protein